MTTRIVTDDIMPGRWVLLAPCQYTDVLRPVYRGDLAACIERQAVLFPTQEKP